MGDGGTLDNNINHFASCLNHIVHINKMYIINGCTCWATPIYHNHCTFLGAVEREDLGCKKAWAHPKPAKAFVICLVALTFLPPICYSLKTEEVSINISIASLVERKEIFKKRRRRS